MINNKKIELTSAIVALSMEIVNTSDIDIFIDFSSHVRSFTVKVILNGWNYEYEPNLYEIIYLDRNCVNKLNEVLSYLKKLKEEL